MVDPQRRRRRSSQRLGVTSTAGSATATSVVAARAARPRRQIAIDRRVTEFGQQRHAAAFGDELRHLRFRIAEVAEVARARRAHLHAGGLAFGLGEVLVVDAVDAQRALLHHAFDLAVLARAVRAGPRTQLAADALVLVDQHDAVVRALVARAGRAHGDARRRFAMQARAREVQRHRRLRGRFVRRGHLFELVAVHAVEPHARRILAVGCSSVSGPAMPPLFHCLQPPRRRGSRRRCRGR